MAQAISDEKKILVKELYQKQGLSMNEVAHQLGVSIHAVIFFTRKHDIKRRTQKEAQQLKFQKKPLSFERRKLISVKQKELCAIGAMLYWAEGYKGTQLSTNSTVDFANSDPAMIGMFIRFLRSSYIFDESRLRVLLYCYSDQNIDELVKFWSNLTYIPKSQFSKPYVRSDFRIGGRKMPYGLIHVRYSDKKLLLDIKSMIEYYVNKYAPVV